jgi:hypothetical protein
MSMTSHPQTRLVEVVVFHRISPAAKHVIGRALDVPDAAPLLDLGRGDDVLGSTVGMKVPR